ncbi:MAG: hypothetical protein Q4B03_06295 [Lachnospiraceae bacterium]|nr:hypothetical protein [Lachnospiraceae bacterium]
MKFTKKQIFRFAEHGEFGLEKESLRITKDGFIAETDHPFPGDPKRDRDFFEGQLEMITGVSNSVEELFHDLTKLHNETTAALEHSRFPGSTAAHVRSGTAESVRQAADEHHSPEYLWPFSNPPYIDDLDSIRIAAFTGKDAWKTEYRKHLEQVYGKKRMLFSGIHMNFSFSSAYLEEYGSCSVSEFQNALYLDLTKKILKYSWLIVYLTAASPLLDGSYVDRDDLGKDIVTDYASIRTGQYGYWNHFTPVLDFSSVEAYADSIESYVENGMLMASSELYYPVRLKPRGANSTEHLKEAGANHIELRMLDLNPLSPVGIDQRDVSFIYLLLLYLMSEESPVMNEQEQLTALANLKHAAKLEANSKSVIEAAEEILNRMKEFFIHSECSDSETPNILRHASEILDYQLQKVIDPEQRYAKQIVRQFGEGYVEKGLKLIGIRSNG